MRRSRRAELLVYGDGQPHTQDPYRIIYCFMPCRKCGRDIGGFEAIAEPYRGTKTNSYVYHPDCFPAKVWME